LPAQDAGRDSGKPGSYALRLSESDAVKGSNIIPVTDQFVGLVAVQAGLAVPGAT
jgi:hypothetical protein